MPLVSISVDCILTFQLSIGKKDLIGDEDQPTWAFGSAADSFVQSFLSNQVIGRVSFEKESSSRVLSHPRETIETAERRIFHALKIYGHSHTHTHTQLNTSAPIHTQTLITWLQPQPPFLASHPRRFHAPPRPPPRTGERCPVMDDYQKHLERQLQQQQQQLRNQANELGTTRTLGPAFLQQPQQQQQQQQQRIQQPPLQWSMNNIPGNTLQTGNPGFGRGGPVLGNPTNSLAGHQHQIQQPGQPIPPSYSASPQQHVPNLQSTVQVPVMKNQGSPAPGSPHQGSDDRMVPESEKMLTPLSGGEDAHRHAS